MMSAPSIPSTPSIYIETQEAPGPSQGEVTGGSRNQQGIGAPPAALEAKKHGATRWLVRLGPRCAKTMR